MKVMFTVGEVARLHKMQKQTLIFYDKENVFKPSIIDERNGYRYYTADQLEVLDSILMLRDIGLSLKQIKSFLEKREPKAAASALEEQKHAVSKQAERLRKTAQRLGRKLETLNVLNTPHEDRIVLTKKDEYFATEKILPPNTLLQTDIATKKLLTKAYSEEYPFYYQVGVIVPLENLLSAKYEEAEYACLPLMEKIKADNVLTKPAGLYACGYHCGKYSQIGASYKRILSFVEKCEYIPQKYAFEYCISDSLTAKSPSDYVTEIQIPVKVSKREQ